MKESYKRKLIAAFEAVDSLILNDEDLIIESETALGEAVVHLHSELLRVLEISADPV